MDTKRTFLAIAISFVILMGWNYLADHMGWVKKPEPQEQQQQQQQPAVQASTAKPTELTPLAHMPASGKQVVVETPLYKAVLHSGGGVLQSFALKQFRSEIGRDAPSVQMVTEKAALMAPLGLLLDGAPTWSNGAWTLEGQDLNLDAEGKGTLRFVAEHNGLRLIRDLHFSGESYAINENVRIISNSSRAVRVTFTMSTGSLDGGSSQYNVPRIAYFQDGKFREETSESTLQTGINPKGDISWIAIMSNYFLAAISPQNSDVAAKGKLQDGVFRVAIEKDGFIVQPGQESAYSCLYYLGPKEQSHLNALPNNLSAALDYGMFSIIARPLMAMLKFFYGYTGNYGVAIILLTLIIKIVLWPLSYKSYKSMEQMKKLQPLMAKLKEKHGGDKETLNREMMQLYKTYKVNPAGGCLPILVQIPVFFGLYQGLLSAIELRHAPFIHYLPFTDLVWLADLSAKDPFYITPLIMGGTMFLQQWITPAAGDPTQNKIMMIMPVVFTFLFLNFPSGLVLYWLTNNVISIAQQWWQLRRA